MNGIHAGLGDAANEGTNRRSYAADTLRPGTDTYRDAVSLLQKIQLLRRTIFPRSLFSDPAWDLLLALYKAHLLQHRLSILRLGKSAEVAPTDRTWSPPFHWGGRFVIDYWLIRYREALEKASSSAPSSSSSAYLELARHYWAMHRRLTKSAVVAAGDEFLRDRAP